jgi:hypothetical protein
MIRIEGITTVAARLAAAHKVMLTQSAGKIGRTAKIVARRQSIPNEVHRGQACQYGAVKIAV